MRHSSLHACRHVPFRFRFHPEVAAARRWRCGRALAGADDHLASGSGAHRRAVRRRHAPVRRCTEPLCAAVCQPGRRRPAARPWRHFAPAAAVCARRRRQRRHGAAGERDGRGGEWPRRDGAGGIRCRRGGAGTGPHAGRRRGAVPALDGPPARCQSGAWPGRRGQRRHRRARANPHGGAHRVTGAAAGPDRHRQGNRRARHSCTEPARPWSR
jgi:hypothetical protein